MDEFPYYHWYERLRWSASDLMFGFLLLADVFEMVEDPSGVLSTLSGGRRCPHVLATLHGVLVLAARTCGPHSTGYFSVSTRHCHTPRTTMFLSPRHSRRAVWLYVLPHSTMFLSPHSRRAVWLYVLPHSTMFLSPHSRRDLALCAPRRIHSCRDGNPFHVDDQFVVRDVSYPNRLFRGPRIHQTIHLQVLLRAVVSTILGSCVCQQLLFGGASRPPLGREAGLVNNSSTEGRQFLKGH